MGEVTILKCSGMMSGTLEGGAQLSPSQGQDSQAGFPDNPRQSQAEFPDNLWQKYGCCQDLPSLL